MILRIRESEADPGQSGLCMDEVRKILLELGKEELLWSAPLKTALSRVLATALQYTKVEVASIWRLSGQNERLVCLAQSESGTGPVPAADSLTASDYPAYFSALNTERVLAAGDAQTDSRTALLVAHYVKSATAYALLDATIRRAGKLTGVLCCETRGRTRVWSPPEIEMAVGLADLAGQLMLLNEMRRRDRWQRVLLSLAPELGQNHTEKELAELALKKLVQLFPKIWAGFFRPESDPNFVQMLVHHAPEAPQDYVDALQRVSLVDSVMGMALRERRIVAVRGDNLRKLNQGEKTIALGITCAIGIPLIHDEKLVGSVIIGIRGDDIFGEDELAAFTLASSTFAVALANARNVEKLRHRALHDSLTGLPNRDKLDQDIESLTERGMGAMNMTMLLLGLKDFKQVNDTLGRVSGDRLLQSLSERVALFAGANEGDAYRLAGDEFAVLLTRAMSDADACALALALQRVAGEPFDVAGLTLILRARIGCASLPTHGSNSRELLRSADIALGWAANSATGVCAYNLLRDTSGPGSLELMAELRKALESDQLSLHLQPKISLPDRRLVGCEALLRWVHPRYGSVPPTSFIAVAEKGDLMSRLTLWVAGRALAHSRELRQAGLDISIAINVSAHNMVDAEFPSQLQALIVDSGLGARAITLEITETVLMSDPERAASVIAELAANGLSLDIDDFGTGYSSLSYLRRLPLTSLKIDRAFVMELTANVQDVHIVRSTVGLAHGLGLSVIAEGVEDEATLTLLGELGCDMAQGYEISRPQTVAEFILWARRWVVDHPGNATGVLSGAPRTRVGTGPVH